MRIRHYISVIIICLAIGGLGFTSLFFYDYNTKIVMVEEIQEEAGEDISQLEARSDEYYFHNWNEVILGAAETQYTTGILLSRQVSQKTSRGFFLDLIKPPIL